MYKLAEQKLLEEIEKLEKEFEPKNEELKDITERLNNITTYNDLKDSNFQCGFLGFICFIIGGGVGGLDIWAIVKCLLENTLILSSGFLIGLGAVGVVFLGFTGLEIKFIKVNNKEIKELEQKGVKKDKKEENLLKDRKIELKLEESRNQSKIREINAELEHIAFYNETANDLFYQADTKEEYDLVLDKDGDYEKLFNEYLEEKVDYSSISFFDPVPSEITLPNKEISLRKIYK